MPNGGPPNFDEEDILREQVRRQLGMPGSIVRNARASHNRSRLDVTYETVMGNYIYDLQSATMAPSNTPNAAIPPELPEPELPEPVFPQPDNATLDRLMMATHQMSMLYDVDTSYMSSLGRREADYINMLKNQKREAMRAAEFVSSEIPQRIVEVRGSILKDILSSRLCGDLVKSGSRYHFVCHSCSLDTPSEYAYFCNGYIWCAEHVPNLDMCAICHELQTECTLITNRYGDPLYVCKKGLELLHNGLYTCRHCSHPIPDDGIEWIGTNHCPHCITQNRSDGIWRNFSRELKWVGKDKGAIVKSTRTFSCEIEALTSMNDGIRLLSTAIPVECGISIDGSVECEDGDEAAFEIQTPRLAGKKGEECVRRAVACLHSVEASVNHTCGLHIHLDGKGLIPPRRREYPVALLQLWKTHLLFEDVMLSLLPYERRSNDFCRLMAASFKITEVDMCDSIFDVEKLWYKVTTHHDIRVNKQHHYHTSRYFGVNLHSLLANGHLEIRYHSGTTNGRKILEWANLHCLIMDACAAKKMSFDFFKEAQALTDLRQKTDLLLEKIGMTEASKQYFYRRQKKFADRKNGEALIA